MAAAERDEIASKLEALASGRAEEADAERSAARGDSGAESGRDDDAVIVPAPDLSVFQPRQRPRAARTPIHRTLKFRLTLIPILMVCGLLLPAVAVWSMLDEDAVLADLNPTLAAVLCITGAVLLALWVLNVLHVRQELGLRRGRGD